jgi:adenine-specific DNA-methyltransferase
MGEPATFAPPTPVEQAETSRFEATRRLDPRKRALLGQFLTPASVARFMASLFRSLGDRVRILEPGAGAGALLAAVVTEACARAAPPRSIEVTAFEIDPVLAPYLRETLASCAAASRRRGVRFRAELACEDFVEASLGGRARFTHAILNPPYTKLPSGSEARRRLRAAGLDTNNLYAAFVALAVQLLEPGGEIVAITPRSFCNGAYFRSFREFLLRETALVRIHVVDSRTAAFSDDAVLQENVVFHLVKGEKQKNVILSRSVGADVGCDAAALRTVPFGHIVHPGDKERFLHLVPDRRDRETARAFAALPSTLADLGVSVSTGRVVDFRAKEFLRMAPGPDARPLIYPTHFADGVVRWPKTGKKPNALVDAAATAKLWMPRGTYVLVKRFSSKEERRRVVAAVFDPGLVPCEKVGFENHLNVLHEDGRGLGEPLARGLAAFLNTSVVDAYFRQWSGSTQVNATDLRSLRYPSRSALEDLGKRIGRRSRSQEATDEAARGMFRTKPKPVSSEPRPRGMRAVTPVAAHASSGVIRSPPATREPRAPR